MAAWPSFLDYALYVSFFPQLVAGPIVRASEFLPQCRQPARIQLRHYSWGLMLLLFGLFLKVVVADGFCAPIADKVFNATRAPDTLSAWCGTLAFTFQVFCDFAGYSHCAIGVVLCLGFALPDNFRCPYAAIGFSEFWRRWHISLSTWLRDYLYIPLGGSRGGTARTLVNLAITMLLGGLWHGAGWSFILWGGLHGLLLVVERLLVGIPWLRRLGERRGGQFLGWALTFTCVCITMAVFRSPNLTGVLQMTSSLLGLASNAARVLVDGYDLFVACSIALIGVSVQRALRNTTLEAAVGRFPAWGMATAVGLMALALTLTGGEDRVFIYFQF